MIVLVFITVLTHSLQLSFNAIRQAQRFVLVTFFSFERKNCCQICLFSSCANSIDRPGLSNQRLLKFMTSCKSRWILWLLHCHKIILKCRNLLNYLMTVQYKIMIRHKHSDHLRVFQTSHTIFIKRNIFQLMVVKLSTLCLNEHFIIASNIGKGLMKVYSM